MEKTCWAEVTTWAFVLLHPSPFSGKFPSVSVSVRYVMSLMDGYLVLSNLRPLEKNTGFVGIFITNSDTLSACFLNAKNFPISQNIGATTTKIGGNFLVPPPAESFFILI